MTARKKTAVVTAQAAPPADEATALIAMIERVARDPNADIEKMERLFALRKEALADAAEASFNAALARVQAVMPQVARDAENSQTSSMYALLESISKAIKPIYTSEGFSISFNQGDGAPEGYLRILATLSHAAGHSRDYHADIPIDLTGMKGNVNKTQTHAYGSTMSYGRRYLTLLIFDVALRDEDDDGNAAGGKAKQRGKPATEAPRSRGNGKHGVVTAKQVGMIKARLGKAGISEAEFLKAAGVESFEALAFDRVDGALKWIGDYRAA